MAEYDLQLTDLTFDGMQNLHQNNLSVNTYASRSPYAETRYENRLDITQLKWFKVAVASSAVTLMVIAIILSVVLSVTLANIKPSSGAPTTTPPNKDNAANIVSSSLTNASVFPGGSSVSRLSSFSKATPAATLLSLNQSNLQQINITNNSSSVLEAGRQQRFYFHLPAPSTLRSGIADLSSDTELSNSVKLSSKATNIITGLALRFGSSPTDDSIVVIPISNTTNTSSQAPGVYTVYTFGDGSQIIRIDINTSPSMCSTSNGSIINGCINLNYSAYTIVNKNQISSPISNELNAACGDTCSLVSSPCSSSCMICDGQQVSGADVPVSRRYRMNTTLDTFRFDYGLVTAKDRIKVWNGASLVFDTGCTSESNTTYVKYSRSSPVIRVDVEPNCACMNTNGCTGATWWFKVYCLNTTLVQNTTITTNAPTTTARTNTTSTVLTTPTVTTTSVFIITSTTTLSSSTTFTVSSLNVSTSTGSIYSTSMFSTIASTSNVSTVSTSNASTSSTVSTTLSTVTSGQWLITGNMNLGRTSHAACVLPNGTVLVTGGSYTMNSANAFVYGVELYDPSSGLWTWIGNATTGRASHTLILLSTGKVLVTGGLGYSQTLSASVYNSELYDPSTKLWTTTGSMAMARFSYTASILKNGKVLAVGGINAAVNNTEPSPQNIAEIYDPSTNLWTTTASMTSPRYLHTQSTLNNGKVLIAGGIILVANGYSGFAADLYDPLTGVWTTGGNMATLRYGHTASVLLDGTVLVTGGYALNTAWNPSNGAELYDPLTGLWTITGNMSAARYMHTASVLQNGKVLVCGGLAYGPNNTDMSRSAELYDPLTRRWTLLNNMYTARQGHTTSLLTNDKILVTGGYSSNIVLNSAELYG